MREIKFRQLNKHSGEWHYWGYIDNGFIAPLYKNDTNMIPGDQFTNLKDKNRKEIYEGDIIDMCYGLARVYFEHGCFRIEFDTDSDLLWLYCCKGDDTIAIGNIYQNPELLKQKEPANEVIEFNGLG